MSRLTEAEREAVWRHNARADCRERYPTKGRMQQSLREVLHERDALAARLAKVEALAKEWERGGDRLIERNQDRRSPAGQQRWVEGYAMRRAASALRAALDADVPAEGRR